MNPVDRHPFATNNYKHPVEGSEDSSAKRQKIAQVAVYHFPPASLNTGSIMDEVVWEEFGSEYTLYVKNSHAANLPTFLEWFKGKTL